MSKSKIILSILIPSMHSRAKMLSELLYNIEVQKSALPDPNSVEVITAIDFGTMVIGKKRNLLLQSAKGEYTVFIDDDDEIPTYYIDEILKAAANGSDAIAMNGTITEDGKNERRWFISKDNPYIDSVDEKGNKIYLRYNNHISPIKREISQKFSFPEKDVFEDYDWATKIKNSGLIKTESTIEKPMYHYKFIRKK